jgi:ABC-type amino acid transport substrate-binding protein
MNELLQFKKSKLVLATMFALSLTVHAAETAPAKTTASSTAVKSAPTATASVKPEEKAIPYVGTTFDKIKSSGKVIIGFRGTAIPLSYYSPDKKPIGYALDICMNIVDKLKQEVNMPNLAVEFVETTPATREGLVISGKVDYECGATSTSESRRKNVAFTVPYFFDAVKMLVKTNSNINSLEDIRNKTVSFGQGTVAIPLMKKIDQQRVLGINFKETKNYASGVNEVEKNESVALITNALLLEGAKLGAQHPEQLQVVGNALSVEPTTIMFRKNDPEFQKFIDKQMIRIASSGQMKL